MEDNLRVKYNQISIKRQALIKHAEQLRIEAKKLYHDMKVIIKEHNDNTRNAKNKYDLDNPPDIIVTHTFDINYLLSIPDDIFQHYFLQYLSIKDIGQLDNVVTNINYRSQYLEKITNSILGNSRYYTMDQSALLWLKKKRLYVTNMSFRGFLKKSNCIDIHEVFRHCEGLDFTLTDRTSSANTLSWFISQCGKLKSLKISGGLSSKLLVDNFSKYCTGLQSLDLKFYDSNITDESVISISKNCTRLQSLGLFGCHRITNNSIISISKNCTILQSLHLVGCICITDESIFSIAKNCTILQSLHLVGCSNITDESIISISKNCIGLQSLDLSWCRNITDKSVISISKNCTGLQSLDLTWCRNITDESIISITKNCTRLVKLFLHQCSNITDAALIELSIHCKALAELDVTDCSNISIALCKRYTALIQLQEAIASL